MPPTSRVGVASITENLLKRKWSTVILRHLEIGHGNPSDILKLEPDISAKVLSERLRTMVRYGVVARFPMPGPENTIDYRITILGKKILEMIVTIEQLDRSYIIRKPIVHVDAASDGQTS